MRVCRWRLRVSNLGLCSRDDEGRRDCVGGFGDLEGREAWRGLRDFSLKLVLSTGSEWGFAGDSAKMSSVLILTIHV